VAGAEAKFYLDLSNLAYAIRPLSLCLSVYLSSPVCPVLSATLVYYGQTVRWINTKLGNAGRPRPWSHCDRWGPSSPLLKGGGTPNFRPMSVVAKWLDGSRCHLVKR